MSIFTPDEIEYLESGLLGRLATVGPDGTPHIAPVHTLCHPTNCAFRGEELFTSNLGRWHILRIEARSEGLVLP